MSNSIHTASLFRTMEPPKTMAARSENTANRSNTGTPQGGLFDQFLSQAEKEFIANRLQELKLSK